MSYHIREMQGIVTQDQLMDMAEAMVADSRFARLGLDRGKLYQHVRQILTTDNFLALGGFKDGVLSGMCIGVCGKVLPFTQAKVATQHYLYVSPDHRGTDLAVRLVYGFISAAKHRGAQDVVFSNGYGGGPEKVGRLYEKCGLKLLGGVYSLGA